MAARTTRMTETGNLTTSHNPAGAEVLVGDEGKHSNRVIGPQHEQVADSTGSRQTDDMSVQKQKSSKYRGNNDGGGISMRNSEPVEGPTTIEQRKLTGELRNLQRDVEGLRSDFEKTRETLATANEENVVEVTAKAKIHFGCLLLMIVHGGLDFYFRYRKTADKPEIKTPDPDK